MPGSAVARARLAELAENAAYFSPREAPITLSARESPDGGIQIDVAGTRHDHGPPDGDERQAGRPPVADALQHGLFDAHGLDVTPVTLNSGAQATGELLSGQLSPR